MAGPSGSLKSIYYALAANSAIAIAKFIAAFITSSGAMLAEAIHSVADTGNQILLLFGMKRSKRSPSPEHPLGHGKAIYFWSFIVAIMLFSMGGLFSLYEGIHKLQNPEPLNKPWIAIGVLIFAILAEGGALFGCITQINKVRGQQSLWSWFRTSRQSELIVILGEDVAAQLGLMFALIFIGLSMVTGNPIYDAIGTMGIGVLLFVIAIMIAKEVHDLLIGQGVNPRIEKQMRAFLAEQESIAEVFNFLSLQMGHDVMIAIKARMNHFDTNQQMIEAINAVEAKFKAEFPQTLWLFFEPDIVD